MKSGHFSIIVVEVIDEMTSEEVLGRFHKESASLIEKIVCALNEVVTQRNALQLVGDSAIDIFCALELNTMITISNLFR